VAATKTRAVILPEKTPTEPEARGLLNDLVMLALPMSLFKDLSDAALKRNMTLPQLLSAAVVDYLKKTET
jgi:hypothetical protein